MIRCNDVLVRRARIKVLGLLGGLIFLTHPLSADAEPRFAIREGVRCADCHLNRTGGGMRTPFGVSFSSATLSTFRLEGSFDPWLGDSVAVGANLRLSNRTVLATETQLGESARSSAGSNSFEIPEGNLYLRASPVPEHLTLYIDETMSPEGASSREAFVMLHGLPHDAYVKAGRFMLPYGLRLPDDTAFIRQETGFTYANQDLGIETGLYVPPVAFALALSNGSLGGSDPNFAKQITAHLALITSWIRGGASFSFNDTSNDDFPFQSITTGVHLGARLGRLLLLGELDWIRGMGEPESYDQLALYTETNFEILKGLFARFVFEAFDPLTSLEENERDRFVLGLSWFPIPYLSIRGEYRLNRDIPQRVDQNRDELLIELHGYL